MTVVRANAFGILVMLLLVAACGTAPSTENHALDLRATQICQISPYAIQHATWDCERMMMELSDCTEIRFAFLWRSFGDRWLCLDRLVGDDRTTLVEVHLINDTCFPERGRECGEHEYNYGREFGTVDVPSLRRWLYDFRGWLRERPMGPEWVVSPMLESNLTAKLGKIVVDETRAALPEYAIVWNPVDAGQLHGTGADLTELHGLDFVGGPDQIANIDGDIPGNLTETLAFQERNRGAFAAFVWSPRDNCAKPGGFVPLLERDCRSD